MGIGSAPGERRGGRKKGVPNKDTILRRISAAEANAALQKASRGVNGAIDLDALRNALADIDAGVTESELVARATAKLERFEGDAHDLLRYVYTDPRRPLGMRIDCAKTAIAYERPRLQAIAQVTETSAEAALRGKDQRTALHDAVAMLLSVPGTTVTHLAVTNDAHVHAGDVLEQLGDTGEHE